MVKILRNKLPLIILVIPVIAFLLLNISSVIATPPCDEVNIEVTYFCYDPIKNQFEFTLDNRANLDIPRFSVYHGPGGRMYILEEDLSAFQVKDYILKDDIVEKRGDNLYPPLSSDLSKISLVAWFGGSSGDECKGNPIVVDKIVDCNNKGSVLYLRGEGEPKPKLIFTNEEVVSEPPSPTQKTTINYRRLFTIIGGLVLIIFILYKLLKYKKRRKSHKPSKPKEFKEEPIKKVEPPEEPEVSHKEKIPLNIKEAVSIENFTVKYKDKIILNKVNLDIKRGEFVSIVGESGAGKSTIIESMVGRKKPLSGKIMLLGKVVGKDKNIYQYVGFVPQSPEIYMNQTVYQNLMTSATKWGVKYPKSKIDEVLDDTNLSNRKDLKAINLSGGQKRLLSLGMELIRDPDLLILDEPTTGLDPNTRNQIITILSHLTRRDNKTVLITTHFMDDAEECDEVIIVGDKKILAQGSPSKLEKRLLGGGKIVSVVLDNFTIDLLKKIEKIKGVEKVIREGRNLNIITKNPDAMEIGQEIRNLGGLVNETRITKSSMKEVFVYFTGEELEE